MAETVTRDFGDGKPVKFSMTLSDIIDAVRTAAYEKFGKRMEGDMEVATSLWVREVYKDKMLMTKDGKQYECSWSAVGGEVVFGEPTLVPVEFSQEGQVGSNDDGKTSLSFSDAEPLTVREAKLFEAGAYPDKGMEVTEGDLDKIVRSVNQRANDGDAVPVKAGHDSPLRFGSVVEAWRKGKELYAKLAFTAANWAHIQADNASKLSVGLLRDKSGLDHVGLVTQPRVADAKVFAFSQADIDVVGEATDTNIKPEVTQMAEETQTPRMSLQEAQRVIAEHNAAVANGDVAKYTAEAVGIAREAQELVQNTAQQLKAATAEFRAQRADMLVHEMKSKGIITPASEPMFRALMQELPAAGAPFAGEQTVMFSAKPEEDAKPVHFAQLVVDMLRANGPVINFREIAKAEAEGNGPTAEEAEYMAEFGLTKDDFAKYGRMVK